MSRTAKAKVIPLQRRIGKEQAIANLEVERALLGSVLLDDQCIWEVMDLLEAEDFYGEHHRRLWDLFVTMAKSKSSIDPVTIKDALGFEGLPSVGGLATIAGLSSAVPTAANATYYATQVKALSLRRGMERFGEILSRDVKDLSTSVEDLFYNARATLDALSQGLVGQTTGLDEQLGIYIRKLGQGTKPTVEETPVSTGIPDLDELLKGGPLLGQLVIVAANSGCGKTAFAINMVRHALRQGYFCYFCTGEMGAEEITTRFIGQEAGVDATRVRLRRLRSSEVERVFTAATRLGEFAPQLQFDTDGDITATAFCGRLRRQFALHGTRVAVLDYFQRLRLDDQNPKDTESTRLHNAIRMIQQTAKELGILVIAVAQLNKNRLERKDPTPKSGDLSRCKLAEDEANHVIYLDQAWKYDRTAPYGVVEAYVVKSRGGNEGIARMKGNPDTMTYAPM